MSQLIRKVVFPVAGMGTRFLPATKTIPKEMLPVVDRPLIQWAVEEAANAGCTEFIFVTAPQKTSIIAHFEQTPQLAEFLQRKNKQHELDLLRAGLPQNAKLTQIIQPEPLGLGHAIWCAREAVGDEAFAVILPDDMVLHKSGCLAQMVAQYEKIGGHLVAVENVPPDQTHLYGIVSPASPDGAPEEGLIRLAGLVEKPTPQDAPSSLGIIGRYIFEAGIMKTLSGGKIGAGDEIQITDAIATDIDRVAVHGFRFSGTRYDCGTKTGFLAANVAFALAEAANSDTHKTLQKTITHILAETIEKPDK